ncbi:MULTISPECIES: hypothetical protein [Providencia]|uniref:hypothetical protein n=1 Tax=Providencia TaxID=586 RepID=UPI00234B97F1|nr:hypothetical protein [Providencia sp. PROV038]
MDEIDWFYSIDWGLSIAVLSLFFTTIISIITIKYTKKSLEYTKRSLKIANDSLNAAQKSIDTSIELYEKQKIDEIKKDGDKLSREIVAIKSILRIEIDKSVAIYQNNKSLCDAILTEKYTKLDLEDRKSVFSVWFYYDGEVKPRKYINVLKTNQSSYIPYFLDAARLDYELLNMMDLTVESLKTIDKFCDTIIEKMKENNWDSIKDDCIFFTNNAFSAKLDANFSEFKSICSK